MKRSLTIGMVQQFNYNKIKILQIIPKNTQPIRTKNNKSNSGMHVSVETVNQY